MRRATVQLRRVVECLDFRRVPLNREERAEISGRVPYWGAGGIVDFIDRQMFDEELVLLGEDGAPFFDSSKDVAYRIVGPSWINNHIHVLRPRGVDPSFLRHSLNVADYGAYISGSTRDKLTQRDMMSIEVVLPSLDEQRRIADFLDAETGALDNVKQRRSRQLATLNELVQSEVDSAIAQAGDPAHVRLGYLAAVQTGVTVDANRQPDRNAVTLPYLRVANVQIGRVDLSAIAEITVPRTAASASMLQEGDVLMTEGGDLDKLGRGTVWRDEITPCLHQNHVFAVRPDKQKLVPDYLALLTRSSIARDYFERTGNRTTNLASTSSSKIRDFRIPLPDVDTQRKVVDQVEERLRWITEFGDHLSHQLALLAERRQALITAAVTGQIDVSTARGVAV